MTTKEATVSLRVFSAVLTCAEVSKFLGLQPTHCHEKGDYINKKSTAIRNESLWIFSPELSGSLEHQLEALADVLLKHKDGILAVASKATLEFYCGISTENGQGNTFLSKSLMRKLLEIEVDLLIEYYLS